MKPRFAFLLRFFGAMNFSRRQSRELPRCANISPMSNCRLARRALLLSLIFVSAVPAEVRAGAADPSHFSFTGSLATARYAHAATLLPNGKVLVAGGSGGNGGLLSAELYDPATASWTSTGNATAFFVSATATLLQNGKVLVVAGVDGAVQLYDPATGTWSFTGSLRQARRFHSTTLLPNGKVLVAGGSDTNGTSLASAELYDPATGNWSLTGSLAKRRASHTATLLPNGKVLVAAGYFFVPPATSDDGVIASAELYDPSTGSWSATGSLQTAREFHTATLLTNGEVLVAGGNNFNDLGTAELYDPTTETWNPTGSLVTARVYHTATLLPSGLVLVIGGSANNPTGYAAAAELFDPATGSWTAAGDLLTGRSLHSATLLPNGKVLVAAGYRNTALSSAELYNPDGLSVTAQFQNIATRSKVLTGDKVLIGGFIITGNAPKKVLLRAIGPSLPLAGFLSNPTLELHQGSATIAMNDDWKVKPDGSSQQAEIEATRIPPTNDLESAIVMTLDPGNYTAVINGRNGGEGIGLIEAYDLDQAAPSQLANISTRGFVDNGDNVMIGGIILGPRDFGGTRLMARALGPSLFIAGMLADPTLELHNSNGDKIASNNNWKVSDSSGQSQELEIRATSLPPTNDFESAIVVVLSPGSYTAIMAGVGGGTGIGLIEFYNLR
jgi:WD40 repeat protein